MVSQDVDLLGAFLVLLLQRPFWVGSGLAAVGVAAFLWRRGVFATHLLRPTLFVFLVVAFATGYLWFALGSIWAHLLAVVLGSSAYTFGLSLGSLLSALAIGTLLARKLAVSETRARDWIGLSLVLAGLSVVSTLEIWDEVAPLLSWLTDGSSSFALVEAFAFSPPSSSLSFPPIFSASLSP